MVMTRGKGVSASYAGGQRQGADPPTVGPSAPPAGVLAPPRPQAAGPSTPPVDVSAPPPQQLQKDRLAALATQVQSLAATVQGLQHQQAAARQPEPFSSVPGVVQPSQHSSRRKSPVLEARHRHASPKPHHRGASKRPRSPSRHASVSPKWRHGKEAERPRRHRRHSFPSSESSGEGSFDGRIARRAERQLDEYNQRLEELSRRITHLPEADYDS